MRLIGKQRRLLCAVCMLLVLTGAIFWIFNRRATYDEVFDSIRIGMSPEEVISAAGKPDYTDSDPYLAMRWLWYDTSEEHKSKGLHSHIVVAWFDENNKVRHRQKGYAGDRRPAWRQWIYRNIGV